MEKVVSKKVTVGNSVFRRKQQKTPNGQIDKRNKALNPAPLVYQFQKQKHSATTEAVVARQLNVIPNQKFRTEVAVDCTE